MTSIMGCMDEGVLNLIVLFEELLIAGLWRRS